MFDEWLNKKESAKDIISENLVSKFIACLSSDFDSSNLLGLHWCLTQPAELNNNLNKDGLIKRGGFFPAIDLPQRMWASSSINFYHKLTINKSIKRSSEIKKIEKKISKKAGELFFIDIEHKYFQNDLLMISEVQTLVYKNSSIKESNSKESSINLDQEKIKIVPNTIMLFRFSALSFNSHRIHYDKDYAINEENYKNLVVQGPLIASLVMNFIQSKNINEDLKEFEFRNTLPAYVNEGLNIYIGNNEVNVFNDQDKVLMAGKYKF